MSLLARATNCALNGGGSLLLVDEFGRGRRADGVALLTVLHAFLQEPSSSASSPPSRILRLHTWRAGGYLTPPPPLSSNGTTTHNNNIVLFSSHYSELPALIRAIPSLAHRVRVLYTGSLPRQQLHYYNNTTPNQHVTAPSFTVHAHTDLRETESVLRVDCMQAFACAQRHGVPLSLVQRGMSLCQGSLRGALAWDAEGLSRVARELKTILGD